MFKNRNAHVAWLSLIAKSVKVLSAPVTLLIISKQLSSEELAFYYTFFSLVSMQQLAELGIGHTMKQFISHAYEKNNNVWYSSSKLKIKGYHHLSKIWFSGVSVFILFVVGGIGYCYLSMSETSINWVGAWFSLVITSSLTTLLTPMLILLDSVQKQELVQKTNLYSGIISSVILWLSLWLNLGLYSITLSLIASLCVSFLYILKPYKSIKFEINEVDSFINIKRVFREIWPLLSRVSIVWGVGFLFWNSFNLVSFGVLDANYAGKIIFCVALAKAGFSIGETIIQSQSTIFSNLISKNEQLSAIKIFDKYKNISVLLLLLGYTFFILFWELFPSFYLFSKLPNKLLVIQIFTFHFLLLIFTLKNNFVRCFKVEPFVKQSIFLGLLLPVTYYFGLMINEKYSFIFCILLVLIVFVKNKNIYKRYFDVKRFE